MFEIIRFIYVPSVINGRPVPFSSRPDFQISRNLERLLRGKFFNTDAHLTRLSILVRQSTAKMKILKAVALMSSFSLMLMVFGIYIQIEPVFLYFLCLTLSYS